MDDDSTVAHVLDNARDPYTLLSLPPNASTESIKSSYKRYVCDIHLVITPIKHTPTQKHHHLVVYIHRLALLLHPDKNKNQRASEAFTAVAAAVSTVLQQKSPASTDHDANWWQAFSDRSDPKPPAPAARDPLHHRQPWSNEKRPTPPVVTAHCPSAWQAAPHPTPPTVGPLAATTWHRPGGWQAPSLVAVTTGTTTAVDRSTQQHAHASKPHKRPRSVVVLEDSDGDTYDVPSPPRELRKVDKKRGPTSRVGKQGNHKQENSRQGTAKTVVVPDVQNLVVGHAHLAAQQRRAQAQATLNAWLQPSCRGVQVSTRSSSSIDEGDEEENEDARSNSRSDDGGGGGGDSSSSGVSGSSSGHEAPSDRTNQAAPLLEEVHQAAHGQRRAAALRVAIALQRTQRLRRKAMQRAHGWGGRKKKNK